jgi:signal peptidase I
MAALLSLVLPGLGHAHLSEFRLAIVGLLGMLGIFGIGLFFTFGTAPGLWVTLGAAGLWELAVTADAFLRARLPQTRPEAWATRWTVLLSLGLVGNILINFGLTGLLAHGARFRLFEIVSKAMEPGLRVGDRVVADMRRDPRTIALQDRVLLESPEDVHVLVISRCAALAGDWVEIRDQGFYRNGVLQEQWALSPQEQDLARREEYAPMFRYGPVRIPEGRLFCLGDNRGNAMDSRMWGPVREDAVQGKVLYTCLHGPKG